MKFALTFPHSLYANRSISGCHLTPRESRKRTPLPWLYSLKCEHRASRNWRLLKTSAYRVRVARAAWTRRARDCEVLHAPSIAGNGNLFHHLAKKRYAVGFWSYIPTLGRGRTLRTPTTGSVAPGHPAQFNRLKFPVATLATNFFHSFGRFGQTDGASSDAWLQ